MERDNTSRLRQDSTHDRRHFLRTVGVVGLGLAATGTAGASEHEEVTEIDSCTVIDEPGEYELVADIEPEEVVDTDDPTQAGPEDVSCIEIRASDVTLHGNGHTIDGHAAQEGDSREGHAIGINSFLHHSGDNLEAVENVVVEDVHVTGFGTGVRFEAVNGGRIAGIVARDNADGIGFHYWANGIDVENNRLIENGAGFNTYGDPDVYGGPAGNVIEHNDIESNATGVRLGHETHDHTFRYNRIVGNGNGVDHSALFTSGNDYHHNAICGNERYGIHNPDVFFSDVVGETDDDFRIEDVVNATENYWGAANGPSSYGDPEEPFTDPETGRLADGDGDAISESLDPGVANVRFDPILEEFPEDAGADL
ncbi:right-handed parallel beta-helix repeat-containing protein [Halalkalicoccus salilacus]|uniref:right-handed parallel beta-helix repeat-containing protein n=1 Tax=Halalkalicoccus TaxID=332246 RepID=UPI002F960AF2